MKYTYLRSVIDKNLICVETHEIVPVELPPELPVSTYAERLKEAENKAKEIYEMMKAKEGFIIKSLEALQDLSKLVFIYGGAEQYKIIEKSLKALEIVKNKVIPFVSIEENCVTDLDAYRRKELTKEEYELLKEVLL